MLWVTLIGTLIDLEKGIFFGIALSLVLYLYRTSRPTLEPVVPDHDLDSLSLRTRRRPPGMPTDQDDAAERFYFLRRSIPSSATNCRRSEKREPRKSICC